jgi:hypothetical protein
VSDHTIPAARPVLEVSFVTDLFWQDLTEAAFCEPVAIPAIAYDGVMPGPLAATELLAETVALAGAALARLTDRPTDEVTVDARLCAFWGLTSCEPIGWTPPEPWDPLSAIFRGSDGWIRLHTNAPHHKAAAISVLGGARTKEEVAAFIAGRSVEGLEQYILEAGGAAARMISWVDWQAHPQGRAISRTPLIEWSESAAQASHKLQAADYRSDRPLSGLRVLDLTRVLAGPVATRTLAGFGADVLRVDPDSWDDPGLLQDTTIGKHCTGLDLRDPVDRATFEDLLSQADIFVHGYRPGALEALGYGQEALDQINPARIDISLSAYGRHGPWAERRGFDSLVQFSAGIAELCADNEGAPGKLPVQALDHAAGYILAACCLEALRRAKSGRVVKARTSLARIAWLLCHADRRSAPVDPIPPITDSDFLPGMETSDWGDIKRLRPPLGVRNIPIRWDVPAGELRRHPALWAE